MTWYRTPSCTIAFVLSKTMCSRANARTWPQKDEWPRTRLSSLARGGSRLSPSQARYTSRLGDVPSAPGIGGAAVDGDQVARHDGYFPRLNQALTRTPLVLLEQDTPELRPWFVSSSAQRMGSRSSIVSATTSLSSPSAVARGPRRLSGIRTRWGRDSSMRGS